MINTLDQKELFKFALRHFHQGVWIPYRVEWVKFSSILGHQSYQQIFFRIWEFKRAMLNQSWLKNLHRQEFTQLLKMHIKWKSHDQERMAIY